MPLEAYMPISGDAKVACGSCNLCCKKARIPILQSYDDANAYQTEFLGGVLCLQHKPNGDCIYLGDAGCTIYDKRPAVCRKYSCVTHYKSLTKSQQKEAVRVGLVSEAVLRAGRQRLAEERSNDAQ